MTRCANSFLRFYRARTARCVRRRDARCQYGSRRTSSSRRSATSCHLNGSTSVCLCLSQSMSLYLWVCLCASTEYLQGRLALETSKPEFSQLPFRFAEIAKVLLDVYAPSCFACIRTGLTFAPSAPDDFQNPDKIRSLLKDIREARQAKSREGLSKIDHSELSVRLAFPPFSSSRAEMRFIFVVAESLLDGDQRNPATLRTRDEHTRQTREEPRGAPHGVLTSKPRNAVILLCSFCFAPALNLTFVNLLYCLHPRV